MSIVGIDPGLKGGIVVIRPDGTTDGIKMPVIKRKGGASLDLGEIAFQLKELGATLVFIERVHAMPKQGVTSVFTFGMGLGGLMGVCAGLEIPYDMVLPQRWQKEVLAGIDTALGKGRAMIYCRRRWPDKTLYHKHDGVADAACIAEYGRRLSVQSI